MNRSSLNQQWLRAIITVAHHYRIDVAEESLKLQLQWSESDKKEDIIQLITKKLSLTTKKTQYTSNIVNPWILPLVIEIDHSQVAIIEKIDSNNHALLRFSHDEGLSQNVDLNDLNDHITEAYIFRPLNNIQDIRVDEYIKPYQKNWFWQILFQDWKRYIDIILASLIANILALATIIFSMNVYDRVIPAQSYPTLWVLAGGVLIAAIFEFSLKMSRTILSDHIGKRADIAISDRVYGRALRIKNKARPKSTGSFIAQIRELESVRELITSTTISSLADLPFFILFVVILAFIGGHIFWLLLIIVPIMLIPSLFVQKRLSQFASEGMRESAIRNALLVESIQNIEDIKLLRAESRFQNQWNHMNTVSATVSMKQRKLVSFLNLWAAQIQGLTYALVIIVGCFAVIDGDMTTGSLVACSILSSRMLAPISNINGILTRLQNAKVAKHGLDELMKKPVDHPERSQLIHRTSIQGHYEFNSAVFKYNDTDPQPTLAIKNLVIKPGEKIAILGRNGAGKSSLLQLLAGMQFIEQGSLTLDGLDINLIDPDDIRRDMGLLNQNSQLFYGTIRENITLGAPQANDDEILAALKIANALDIVMSKKEGLDHLILEGGLGFSGGQKQAILLARFVLKNPNIVLLDEPTAAIDDVSEKILIDHLNGWLKDKTVVIATHRQAILQLVDRIIVMHEGKIAKDIPRDEMLQSFNHKSS